MYCSHCHIVSMIYLLVFIIDCLISHLFLIICFVFLGLDLVLGLVMVLLMVLEGCLLLKSLIFICILELSWEFLIEKILKLISILKIFILVHIFITIYSYLYVIQRPCMSNCSLVSMYHIIKFSYSCQNHVHISNHSKFLLHFPNDYHY